MSKPYHGGCECGAVRYAISGDPIVIYACHCTICQTQSGSAFGLTMPIHAGDFQISKGRLKSFQRTAESGQVFTNSFCPECGTRIHHQASKATNHLSLKPGTLDDTSWLKPTHHVFARSLDLSFQKMPKSLTPYLRTAHGLSVTNERELRPS